jgi:hypothetical protein
MFIRKMVLSVLIIGIMLTALMGCTSTQSASTQQPPAMQQPAAQQQPVNQQQTAPQQQQQSVNRQPAAQQPVQQQPVTQQQPLPQQQQPGAQPAAQQPAVVNAPPATTSTSSTSVTAKVSSTGGLSIGEGETYFTGNVVVKVYNNTSSDINNVKLKIKLTADQDIPAVSSVSLAGGNLTWIFDGQNGNVLTFSCGSGLDVDSDDSEKVTLGIDVYFQDQVDDNATFSSSVNVTSYD